MKTEYLKCFENLDENVIGSILNNNNINRIISPFQLAPLDEKIRQYAYTSYGVRFGDSLENLTHVLIEELGGNYLNKRQDNFDFDNIFWYNNKIILIEQKVRDDHDSTKKVG